MRNFLRALNNYLHLIRSGLCNDEARSSLEVVRHEYHQHYSDAQMIVSDNILSAAGHANGTLMLYGAARRLDDFPVADLSTDVTEDEKETIESAFVLLGQARNRIAHVRDIMRKELGVTQTSNKSDVTATSPSEMLTSAIQRMIDECLGHAFELRKHPQDARFGPVWPAPFGCRPQEAFPHVSQALVARS